MPQYKNSLKRVCKRIISRRGTPSMLAAAFASSPPPSIPSSPSSQRCIPEDYGTTSGSTIDAPTNSRSSVVQDPAYSPDLLDDDVPDTQSASSIPRSQKFEALNREVADFKPGDIHLQLSSSESSGATLKIFATNKNENTIAAIPVFDILRNSSFITSIAQYKQVHIEIDANLDTPELQTYYEWLEITGRLDSLPILCDIESLTWIGSHYFFDVLSKQYNMEKLTNLKINFHQPIGQDRLREIIIRNPGLLTLYVEGVHAPLNTTDSESNEIMNVDRTETSIQNLILFSTGRVDAFLRTLSFNHLKKLKLAIVPHSDDTKIAVRVLDGFIDEICNACGNNNNRPRLSVLFHTDARTSVTEKLEDDVNKHLQSGMSQPKWSQVEDNTVTSVSLKSW